MSVPAIVLNDLAVFERRFILCKHGDDFFIVRYEKGHYRSTTRLGQDEIEAKKDYEQEIESALWLPPEPP